MQENSSQSDMSKNLQKRETRLEGWSIKFDYLTDRQRFPNSHDLPIVKYNYLFILSGVL
jgi:hypothetical protein